MVELETTFPWQAQNRVVNQQSDGQSVVSKVCLEAQAAHLYL